MTDLSGPMVDDRASLPIDKSLPPDQLINTYLGEIGGIGPDKRPLARTFTRAGSDFIRNPEYNLAFCAVNVGVAVQ